MPGGGREAIAAASLPHYTQYHWSSMGGVIYNQAENEGSFTIKLAQYRVWGLPGAGGVEPGVWRGFE